MAVVAVYSNNMKLTKKQKKVVKVVGITALVATAGAIIYKNMKPESKVTTVNPGRPAIGSTGSAAPKQTPVNIGVLSAVGTGVPVSSTPSSVTPGTPGGGSIITSIANNPIINPMSVIPRVLGGGLGGGLFRF